MCHIRSPLTGASVGHNPIFRGVNWITINLGVKIEAGRKFQGPKWVSTWQSSVPFSLRGRVFFECVASVMEGTANLIVYSNGEIIQNTHERVRFVCQNPFSFVVPCTMTLMELQNGLCQNMENSILTRFDIMPIIDEASMQNMFQIHRQTQMRQPQIELYVEFENVEVDRIQNDLHIEDDRAAVYQGMNNDSEKDFEAIYEAGDKDEDGDVGVETAVENVVIHPAVSQPINVPPFMRNLDLDAMNAPEFLEYANIGVADPEDEKFRIGMEYTLRKSHSSPDVILQAPLILDALPTFIGFRGILTRPREPTKLLKLIQESTSCKRPFGIHPKEYRHSKAIASDTLLATHAEPLPKADTQQTQHIGCSGHAMLATRALWPRTSYPLL
ncbi:hypothetical protein AHAS_Ahas01G0181400 [Arachis hypogaea]